MATTILQRSADGGIHCAVACPERAPGPFLPGQTKRASGAVRSERGSEEAGSQRALQRLRPKTPIWLGFLSLSARPDTASLPVITAQPQEEAANMIQGLMPSGYEQGDYRAQQGPKRARTDGGLVGSMLALPLAALRVIFSFTPPKYQAYYLLTEVHYVAVLSICTRSPYAYVSSLDTLPNVL
ncbi:hypothetical protein AXG93_4773s1590 [Marchantia polymorpha subsp. ruderalis]|uniref:Uncharacterized protein n=1 Tax=Marchantia polymorpha subsp. ruderalis TaxID=1480154 RepID=A0A176WLC8_MARPO|nr:hypothetical protein AXG93_4773s1590 [Marchantia polymorpha subsp. ruderalis]